MSYFNFKPSQFSWLENAIDVRQLADNFDTSYNLFSIDDVDLKKNIRIIFIVHEYDILT